MAGVNQMPGRDIQAIADEFRRYAYGRMVGHGKFAIDLLRKAEQWDRDARRVEEDAERIASSYALLEKAVAALAINGHSGPLTSTGTADKILSFTDMYDRAEVCRRKAIECERAATLVTDPDLCRTYFDLARQWREMAAQVEELTNRAQ